ncbi:MAG: hypothetical protein GXO48_06510 [Chlorobi bacterium]|nr:hypothetical protein [Chlorobiota bacterium]
MEKQESVLPDGYSYEVKFVVPPEDYLGKATEELKRVRRKLSIPGFRPGHVPMHVARRLVGEQFLYDILWKIVEEELKKTLEEKEGSLAGDPLIKEAKVGDIRWEKGGPAEITFLIGTKPEIQLPDSIDEPVTLPDVEISDDYIEDYLNRYAYEHGTYEDVDNPEDAQYFILFLHLGDKQVPFVVERNQITEDLIQKLIGNSDEPVEAKLGEDILIDTDQFWQNVIEYVNQYDQTNELRGAVANHQGETDLNVSLSKMQVFKPLELNLENLKKVLIPRYAERVKDEKEAKEFLKEQLKRDLLHVAYRRVLTELLDKLRRNQDIPVPEEYLKALARRKLMESNQKEVAEEEIELEADRLKDRLITDLLIGALLKKLDVTINAQDVIEELARYLYYRMSSSEQEEPSEEELDKYKELALRTIEMGLEREDLWYERVLLDRIVKALLEKGWAQKKSVPVEEFVK